MKMVTTAFWFSSSNRFQMSSLLKMFKNGILKYSIFFIFLIEKLSFLNINLFILIGGYFTIFHWFCHTSTWICHGCTCVPHPEPPSPYHRSGSSQCTNPKHPVSNLDWRFVSYMILYMFQCHSPKSSHPLPLPQSPTDCSIHLCLFCCLAYRVIVTIFLNSIYMR